MSELHVPMCFRRFRADPPQAAASPLFAQVLENRLLSESVRARSWPSRTPGPSSTTLGYGRVFTTSFQARPPLLGLPAASVGVRFPAPLPSFSALPCISRAGSQELLPPPSHAAQERGVSPLHGLAWVRPGAVAGAAGGPGFAYVSTCVSWESRSRPCEGSGWDWSPVAFSQRPWR